MDKLKELLQIYVTAGADLAESVKRNIVHDGIIDDDTIVRLNAFIVAANDLADLDVLVLDDNETDHKLN